MKCLENRFADFGVRTDHNHRHVVEDNVLTWEASRSWHLTRPLVYYLVENFAPRALVEDADVLDFSAGLGDLSRYMDQLGARVVSTLPEESAPSDGLDWRTGISAGHIATRFDPASFDLAVARMVFQFPTWEGDRADPDTLASEFAEVLRPAGRLVVAFHEFAEIEETDPRMAMVRYLGLPPREGPHGESGYGLKVPMLVTTLQNRGFDIELAEHAEPFTFPVGIDKSDEEIEVLGQKVMEVKRHHLVERQPETYDRPGVIFEMLEELRAMFRFVTWPIVRIVARRR